MKEDISFRDFYNLLPRFVFAGEFEYEFDKYLSPIERRVEWDHIEFGLVISPALISDKNSGDKCYFPGKTEQVVESALISMADPINPDFYEKESALVIRLNFLFEIVSGTSGDSAISIPDIELTLHVLSDAAYALTRDNAELNFYSIEQLRRVEKNGEIYYYAKLTGVSCGMDEIFNCFFGKKNLSDLMR
jgi:hypothetical protein